jgi:hypothetical protein
MNSEEKEHMQQLRRIEEEDSSIAASILENLWLSLQWFWNKSFVTSNLVNIITCATLV